MIFLIASVVLIIFLVVIFLSVILNKRKEISQVFSGVTIEQIDAINGEEFEEIVALMLKYNFWKAETTTKSHDYGADIIAKRLFRKVIIQTKLYYNHAVGVSAVQEIVAAKKYYKIKRAVVVTNWHFSKSAIKLAKENNVRLIERKDIIKFLNKINKA